MSFLKLTSPRGCLTNSGRKATVKTISATRNFSPIEKLTIELQVMTLEQLPIRETRNIRLASRSWAAAGVEHLFRRHFIVKPDPGMSRINYFDDLSKLEAVSQNPHISKDLILIEFASSDMPMPHFLLFLLDQSKLWRENNGAGPSLELTYHRKVLASVQYSRRCFNISQGSIKSSSGQSFVQPNTQITICLLSEAG